MKEWVNDGMRGWRYEEIETKSKGLEFLLDVFIVSRQLGWFGWNILVEKSQFSPLYLMLLSWSFDKLRINSANKSQDLQKILEKFCCYFPLIYKPSRWWSSLLGVTLCILAKPIAENTNKFFRRIFWRSVCEVWGLIVWFVLDFARTDSWLGVWMFEVWLFGCLLFGFMLKYFGRKKYFSSFFHYAFVLILR